MKKSYRIALWVLGGLLVLLTIAYLGIGYVVYNKLSKVTLGSIETPSNTPSYFIQNYAEWIGFDTSPYWVSKYEEVSFPSRQPGIHLKGWYLEASPTAPVVVVTHGIGTGKFSPTVLIPAGMLYKHGFNVLIYDMRNHGTSDSDGGRTSVGNKEYLDVLGAWDYLVNERKFDPARVGVMGLSLGAGSTLNAFAAEPQIAAVLVDSPFADLQQIISEELTRTGFPSFLAPAGILSARIFGGVNLLEHSPKNAVIKDVGRPIYIIHGTADKRINIHHSRDLQALASKEGANLAIWYVEGADHVQSMFKDPAGYEQHLVTFFKNALGGDIGQTMVE